MFTLRPYQADAVAATLKHFRKTDEPAVIVLPTGAGKSLVIAELAKLARQRILVLAHVKELVEQNCAKFDSYVEPSKRASVFAAGLKRKESSSQVVFGSVQSVGRNLNAFNDHFSLLIIDECHRVSLHEDSEYQQIIQHLKTHNPQLKVLGLTATPYRLDSGWVYRQHDQDSEVRGDERAAFERCIFELPLRYMIDKGYLTPAKVLDAPVALYDFEQLRGRHIDAANTRPLSESELNDYLSQSKRATARIIHQVIERSSDRLGVMIFAATVDHAREILRYLPVENSAIILGDMKARARDSVIQAFKQQPIKFLVNVSVLTTGFDAPHVDLIAILRPTESVGLYQQIIGRGLRLFEQKKDCVVLDYAGNNYDLFRPVINQKKPNSDAVPVEVPCPICEHLNNFWGLVDNDGNLVEHYGRRCQGLVENEDVTPAVKQQCDFRYRYKECGHCGAENDIAARQCQQCHELLVDIDDKLKQALQLADCKVLRCAGMDIQRITAKSGDERVKITYYDEDGADLSEVFALQTRAQQAAFYHHFIKPHRLERTLKFHPQKPDDVVNKAALFRSPDFVIGKKQKTKNAPVFWSVHEKIFDYEGRYRRANELS